MNPFVSTLRPDPQAMLAHHRQSTAPRRMVQAPDMSLPEPEKRNRFDFKPAILAVCGAVPLTLKEISDRAGVRLPHARNAVWTLSSRGQLRNIAKNGAAGRYVIARADLKKQRGPFDV